MNIIEFVFYLLQQFNLIDPTKREGLKNKGLGWYANINEQSPSWQQFLKKWGEEWYVQVLVALLVLPASRMILNYLNPSPETEEIEDKEIE